MDIGSKARRLERRIARTIDAAVVEFVGGGETAQAPLEIIQAVVDRAEHVVVEAGRGRRVFPFNRIRLSIVAGARDRDARARFAAVVDGPPSLVERIRARLESVGCSAPDLTVALMFVAKAGRQWSAAGHHVEFSRVEASAPAPAPAPAAPPELQLTVVHGKASRRTYTFRGGRIDLGRRAEVLDSKQRLIRTNHVAFDDEGPEANRSVSRRHAHIAYQAGSRDYRLLDDRSAHGTGIVRNGRTIVVPPGSRGIRLQSGDEILLGQARLRVGIES